jgi:DNA topoisomerase-1
VVATVAGEPSFEARLVAVDGKRVATGRDFDAAGLVSAAVVVPDVERAAAIAAGLESGEVSLVVAAVKGKAARRAPAAPFTMSTLIQEAVQRLGMAVDEVSSVAERLFADGLITYPRADAAVHAAESRREIRAEIARRFGSDAVSPDERFTTVKGKRVQGAHEAIRPTDLRVDDASAKASGRGAALYALVWQRTIASQMTDARGETTTLRLLAGDCEFSASGTVWSDPGWRRVWPTRGDDSVGLPEVGVGDVLEVESAAVVEHATQPPARFNEATLVRAMEEMGIGRPSTYAKIIGKLRGRYVWSADGDRALIPTLSAIPLHGLLVESFGDIVDYEFTNEMENQLDEVAGGEVRGLDVLGEFWLRLVDRAGAAREHVDSRQMVVARLGVHPRTGEEVVVRAGRWRKDGGSPYVACGKRTVSVSDHTALADLTLDVAVAMLDRKEGETRDLGEHPGLGVPVVVRPSRSGAGYFVQIGADGRWLEGMSKPLFIGVPDGLDAVGIDHAAVGELFADLQRRRRLLGVDASGVEVWLRDGRYGPYVECGSERRSLPKGIDPAMVTVEVALTLLAAPKPVRRRRRGKG